MPGTGGIIRSGCFHSVQAEHQRNCVVVVVIILHMACKNRFMASLSHQHLATCAYAPGITLKALTVPSSAVIYRSEVS